MTAKEFFKSNAFKSLAVLIAIVLVAGALLAVFNDLLYISDEDRLNRTLSKIYGGPVSAETVELSEEDRTNTYGTVNNVYFITDDGNYLLNTTGTGGYKNGTVTVWTVISCEADGSGTALKGIEKVLYESNTAQTLMSNFSDAYFEAFTQRNELLAEDSGAYFTAVKGNSGELNNVVTDTSQSSTAICNAVNAALAWFRTVIAGGNA